MLWYWGDWNSGTQLLSRFLKGCYMDLLHAQFNNGPLSLEEIKTCLGSDFGTSWPTLQKKFKQNRQGLFFNERCECEKLKRQKFVSSRANGKAGRKKSYDKSHDFHTDNHTENEDEDGNKDGLKGGTGENFNTMPKPEDCGQLPEITAGSVIELIRITKSQTVTSGQVKGLWPVFLAQHATGKKYYQNIEAVHSHFINWIKTQKFEDGKLATDKGEQRLNAMRDYVNR